jgi:hypothetical protein
MPIQVLDAALVVDAAVVLAEAFVEADGVTVMGTMPPACPVGSEGLITRTQ